MSHHKKSKIILTFLLTTILWSVIFYLVLISHFEYNPINLSKKYSKDIFYLSPQGWSFFTKDPKYDRVELYKIDGDSLVRVTHPNFSKENLFGFKRKNRQILNEIFLPIKNIIGVDSLWFSTKKGKYYAFDKMEECYNLKNNFSSPILCNQLLIEIYKPIKWAWSSNKNYTQRKKYLLVNLECTIKNEQ